MTYSNGYRMVELRVIKKDRIEIRDKSGFAIVFHMLKSAESYLKKAGFHKV